MGVDLMPKLNITIWNRKFELEVDYDCFEEEEITEKQKEAFEQLVEKCDFFEGALSHSKDYCIKHNKEDVGGEKIDNIFKYIMPKSIYVIRDKEKRSIALMCDYKFDLEHGIAIVYEDEKFVKIVEQDAVL